MHSTEELNKKVWYRLLKILYGLVFILITGITVLLVWSDAYSSGYDTVTCNWDNQSLQEKDLTWYGNDAMWSSLSEDISTWSPDDRRSVAVSCFAKAIRTSGKTAPGYTRQPGQTEQKYLQDIVDGYYPAGFSVGGHDCMNFLPPPRQDVLVNSCSNGESMQEMNASTTISDVEAIAAGGIPTNCCTQVTDWSSQDYVYFLSVPWGAGLYLNDNTNFNITPSTHTLTGLGRFLGYAIPSLLIELLLFEIIRRGFYYVVIGKVFPRA